MTLYKFSAMQTIDYIMNDIERMINNIWSNCSIQEIKFITSGRINFIYRLLLKDSPVKSVILRVRFMNDPAHKQGFASETWVNPILRANNFEQSPNLYYSNEEFEYSILEDIGNLEFDLNSSAEYFYKSGVLLAQIHQINTSQFGKLGATQNNIQLYKKDAFTYYNYYFSQVLEKMRIRNFHLADRIATLIKNYFKSQPYVYERPVLLHHDFHSRNILINQKDQLVLIDWESSRGGVAELDLIKWKYLTFLRCNKQKQLAFISGYESIRPLPLTNNFICHELIWLLKMYMFEEDWPIEEDGYFPKKEFYLYYIDKFCVNLENGILLNKSDFLFKRWDE